MATSPPGFTSAIEPKHVQTYRSIPPVQLPPSGLASQETAIRSEFLQSRIALARLEAEILSRHKEIRTLDPETIQAKAPEYAEDYLGAWTRRNRARKAYEEANRPSPLSRGVDTLAPTTPGKSAVFKGLVAGRKRTRRTRNRRSTKKHRRSK
jgi:hypothetical protein